jgi:type VI protein secretion system component Hcp
MKRIIPLLSATLLCLSFSNASKAQIFVKLIDGAGNLINGESIDARHANEINATTFGQENTGCAVSAGGGGGGAACGGTAGHFIFNMNINASVPVLDGAVFLGTHLRSADIVFRKRDLEYYKIHLESVVVSHVTNSVDPTGLITIQVELAADKMGWTYTPQDATGAPGTPVKFGWNALTRSAWSF